MSLEYTLRAIHLINTYIWLDPFEFPSHFSRIDNGPITVFFRYCIVTSHTPAFPYGKCSKQATSSANCESAPVPGELTIQEAKRGLVHLKHIVTVMLLCHNLGALVWTLLSGHLSKRIRMVSELCFSLYNFPKTLIGHFSNCKMTHSYLSTTS